MGVKKYYKYHYTYYMLIDDPFFEKFKEAGMPWKYVGVRSCQCDPDKDSYMSSSDYVHAAMSEGIVFGKHVIRKHKTRQLAEQDEKNIISEFKYGNGGEMWSWVFNKNVPGEFPEFARAMMRSIVKQVGRTPKSQGGTGLWKGGPSKDYVQTEAHKLNAGKGKKSNWDDMRGFSSYHGFKIKGRGAANIDRFQFRSWRASLD